jgi:glucose/arabinose dehydrogenase
MKPFVRSIVLPIFLLLGCTLEKPALENQSSYEVETIEMPEGLTAEVAALDFFPDGRLIASFMQGEVMTYDPKTKEWELFAEGLHEPLGMLVVNNSEVLIMQLPELTRVKDTDKDGIADVYEKVTDDFGMTGNYHEFAYGPLKDMHGNLFIALNAASSGGEMRDEIRGAVNLLGRDGETGNRQMFSTVPYRGWVMKLTKDGKLFPFASGFRSPNGLGIDKKGNVFATDNQGDWIGTSTLTHVQEGKFYGHPASLVWTKEWDKGSPFELPVATLDSMRTRASILFPHGVMANSPTQPLIDNTRGKFGPFEDQLFVGEMNRERIVRVMLEKVDGEFQGASIPFLDGQGLRKGNNRLAFAPDGSLWVGQNDHEWLGDRGIQRITYSGKKPFDILKMNLTDDGFKITFTQPLKKEEALKVENYLFKHYYYEYHKKYGSDQMDVQDLNISGIKLSSNRKSVTIHLDKKLLKPGYVYELNLKGIQNDQGKDLENTLVCYTLNRLKVKSFWSFFD